MVYIFKKNVIILFVVLLINLSKNVFPEDQTRYENSSETANPFNNMMFSKDDVNLYSGNVSFTQPLYVLGKINGVRLPIELQYSSNVLLNARAKNDIGPASNVGLGWSFGFSSIKLVTHNGTKTHNDDKFCYISPQNIPYTIYSKDSKYFIQSKPFWKVTPHFNASAVIDGWEIIQENGVRYQYGNYYNNTSKSTRYIFSWGEYVANGFSSSVSPSLFPYQWDICAIKDIDDYKINFIYQPITEPVVSDLFNSGTLEYTKTSYICEINNSFGEKIYFTWENKEFLDPYQFKDEPDAFMEFYEDKRLKKIEIKDLAGRSALVFNLYYSTLDHPQQDSKKSLLTRIEKMGSESTIETFGKYDYYGAEYLQKGEYNYGAMRSRTNSLGGVITYSYIKKQSAKTNKQVQKRYNWSLCKPMLKNMTLPTFISSGSYDNGKEAVGFISYPDKKLTIIHWNGHEIVYPAIKLTGKDEQICDNIEIPADFTTELLGVQFGADHFAIVDEGHFVLFSWDGKRWVQTFTNEQRTAWYKLLHGDIFLKIEYPDRKFTAYHWNGSSWLPHTSLNGVKITNDEVPAERIFVGNSIICLNDEYSEHEAKIWVYNWDGNNWSPQSNLNGKTYQLSGENKCKCELTQGNNFFVLKSKSQAIVFRWDGHKWIENWGPVGYSVINSVVAGDDYFTVVCGSEDDKADKIFSYIWNGEEWIDKSFQGYDLGNTRDKAITPGVNCQIIQDQKYIRIYHKQKDSWINMFTLNLSKNVDHASIYSGDNYLIISENNPLKNNFNILTFLQVWVFDGYNWRQNFNKSRNWDKALRIVGGSKNMFYEYQADLRIDNKGYSYCDDKRSSCTKWGVNCTREAGYECSECTTWEDYLEGRPNCCVNAKVKNLPNYCDACEDDFYDHADEGYDLLLGVNEGYCTSSGFNCLNYSDLYIFNKNQDDVNTKSFSYVVNSIKIAPVFGTEAVYLYEFYNDNYSTDIGDLTFGKVKVIYPDYNGSTTYYFYNDNEEQMIENPKYKMLDGYPYLIENRNCVNYCNTEDLISEKKIKYCIWESTELPNYIYQIRETEVCDKLHNVSQRITFEEYNNKNGLPRLQKSELSNGKWVIQKTVGAHEIYPDMESKNMLAQVYKITTYCDNTLAASASKSDIKTWAIDNGVWHVKGEYAWVDKLVNNSGENPLPDFPGDLWKLQNSFTIYDNYSNIIENRNATGTFYSSIFGYNNRFLIASIQNAKRTQCAYLGLEFNTPNNFADWEAGGATISDMYAYSGIYSANCKAQYGPTKNISYENLSLDNLFSKTFIFSAAVKVIGDKTCKMVIECRNGAGAPVVPNKELIISPKADWQIVELATPDLSILPAGGYIRIWCGAPDAGSECFVDELRFCPANALMITYAYDLVSNKENYICDQNLKRTIYKYDEFGRLTEQYNNAKILEKRTEYNLYGNCIQVLKPMLNDGYLEEVPIEWDQLADFLVNIYYSSNNGKTWNLIVSNQTPSERGHGKYTWSTYGITPGDNFLIKIEYSDTKIPKEMGGVSGNFSINFGNIIIQSPGAGVVYFIGGKSPIEWVYSGQIMSNVDIEYSFDEGGTWSKIATVTNKNGNNQYLWDLSQNSLKFAEGQEKLCVIKISGETDSANRYIMRESNLFILKNNDAFIRRLVTWIRCRLPQ